MCKLIVSSQVIGNDIRFPCLLEVKPLYPVTLHLSY